LRPDSGTRRSSFSSTVLPARARWQTAFRCTGRLPSAFGTRTACTVGAMTLGDGRTSRRPHRAFGDSTATLSARSWTNR
jgi:hypothetical protein